MFDSDTIAQISYLPKFLVVQGAGIAGLEYAQIFAQMGAKVVVVETFDKVAAMLDSSLQDRTKMGTSAGWNHRPKIAPKE